MRPSKSGPTLALLLWLSNTAVSNGQARPAGPATAAATPAPVRSTTSVGGVVFVDANGNGRLDAGERPLAGANVWLRLCVNGAYPKDDYPYPIGADGKYTFQLIGGSFQLHAVLPPGYALAAPADNPVTITVTDGHPVTGFNFAAVPVVPPAVTPAPSSPATVPSAVAPPRVLPPAVVSQTVPPQTPTIPAATFAIGVDGGTPVAAYTASPAPATVHVNAVPLTAHRGDWLGERYAWNFGDAPGGQTAVDPTTGQTVDLSAGQTWPVAAYVFENPGTYPVTLTRTTAAGRVITYQSTVTVPAPTRTTLYVDSVAGDDANAGSLAAPFQTLVAAWTHVRSHTAVLLKGGGSYPANALWLPYDDVLVDRYGDPAQPDPILTAPNPTHYSPVDVAVFNFSAGCSNVTVRHVRTDCTFSTAVDPYKRPYEAAWGTFGYVRGRNVTVSDLTFDHSFNGYHGTGDLHGGLVLRCRQVGNGAQSQAYWYEGRDVVAIGNRGLNSSLESTMRAANTGLVRGTIAFDEHAQLVDAEYPLGTQKCPVTLRTLSDVTVYHCHAVNGYMELAPRSPATLVQYVVADGNVVDGGWLWIKTNVRYTRVRNTLIRMTLAGGGNNCVEMGSNGNGVDLWNEGNSVTGTVASGPPGCRLLEVDPLPAGAIRGDTFGGQAVVPGLRMPMVAATRPAPAVRQ